jgi:hypothetical protein
MTIEDVIKALQKACAEAGDQKTWAAAHGLSGAYISDVIRGRRDPGERILTALGLERVTTYRKLRN